MWAEHLDFQNTSLEKTNKDTKLATEQQNRENINVLTTKISTALGSKFEQKGLPFDIKAFRLHLNQAVEKVFLNPNIPDIAKEKFKQDILGKIDLLAKVDESDVNVLKYRRILESLSVELWELWNKTDTEKQAYFLDKILTETIGKYVEPVAYSLEQAFDTREKVGAWEYNQKWVQWLFKKINTLDAAENAQVWSTLTKILPQGDIANPLDPGIRKRVLGTMLSSFGTDKKEVQVLLRELQSNTFDSLVESYKKFGPIKPSSRPSIFQSNTPEAQVLLTKIIPYIDAYDEFAGNEKDIRTVRNIALSNDPLGKAKEAIGMEQLKSEFDHLKPANIEEKMKKASFSDMVIMGTQLAQLAPIAGDIGGWFDGIVSALSGMNVQWAKLDALDRFMNGFLGILGITVIWGVAARAQKAGKMAEIIRSFGLMKKYMPEKLEAFLKAGGKLGEEAKEGIKKFGKMMGKEIWSKIDEILWNYTGKMGMRMGIIEDGKSVRQSTIQSPVIATKRKQYDNLLNPEKYQQEKDVLNQRRKWWEMTQKEYRLAQADLIMEQALQRSNEMFLEWEKILRTHSDIKPDEMVKMLREHFKTNNIRLSRFQESMIDNIPRILQEAIDSRQQNLKRYFDLARKPMPEKMEDIQKMINEDPDVNFELWKEKKLYKELPVVRNHYSSPEEYKKTLTRQEYDISEKVTIDITTHPTVVIEYIPTDLWSKPEAMWYYISRTSTIHVNKVYMEDASGIIEHEYTHFLNDLVQKLLKQSQSSEVAIRSMKIENSTGSGLYEAQKQQLYEKSTSRIGKDAIDEFYTAKSDYSRDVDWLKPEMLWKTMQDEILAYLKWQETIPPLWDISPFLNGRQKQLLQEWKISVGNQTDIVAIQWVLITAKERHIPNENIMEIVRTSGTIQLTYERLLRSFPEQMKDFWKWDAYRNNVLFSWIQNVWDQGLEVEKWIRAFPNGWQNVFLSHVTESLQFFRFSGAWSVLSEDIISLQKCIQKFGNKNIVDFTRVDFMDPLLETINIRAKVGEYEIVVNKGSNNFSISRDGTQTKFSTLDEFLQWIDKIKDEQKVPRNVEDFKKLQYDLVDWKINVEWFIQSIEPLLSHQSWEISNIARENVQFLRGYLITRRVPDQINQEDLIKWLMWCEDKLK